MFNMKPINPVAFITATYPESNDKLALTAADVVAVTHRMTTGSWNVDATDEMVRAGAMVMRRANVAVGNFPGGRKIGKIIASIESGTLA
jgi:hypothetical protein